MSSRPNKSGGVIEIITHNSVVLEGRTYVQGAGARITILPGTFFELVQIAGAIYAPGTDSLVQIEAPEAVYINGEILAGVEWQGGVPVKSRRRRRRHRPDAARAANLRRDPLHRRHGSEGRMGPGLQRS